MLPGLKLLTEFIVQAETVLFISTLLMLLPILSKGEQRRKSGEKRKDRKKEATEEEKGCSEKENLVLCHLQMDRSAFCSHLCQLSVNLFSPSSRASLLPTGVHLGFCGDSTLSPHQALLVPIFMCFLNSLCWPTKL